MSVITNITTDSRTLKVTIRSPDESKIYFLIGKGQSFEDLFYKYCEMQLVWIAQMKYTFKGQEVSGVIHLVR